MTTASDIPETAMNERCAGCAFRPGTQASQSPFTAHLAKLCVYAGVPFECHDEGAGHLCRGFVDAFTAKLANGDYNRLPEWKNQLARNLIDVMQDSFDAQKNGLPFDADEAVRRAVELVGEVEHVR